MNSFKLILFCFLYLFFSILERTIYGRKTQFKRTEQWLDFFLVQVHCLRKASCMTNIQAIKWRLHWLIKPKAEIFWEETEHLPRKRWVLVLKLRALSADRSVILQYFAVQPSLRERYALSLLLSVKSTFATNVMRALLFSLWSGHSYVIIVICSFERLLQQKVLGRLFIITDFSPFTQDYSHRVLKGFSENDRRCIIAWNRSEGEF